MATKSVDCDTPDSELVLRSQAGETDAFAVLFKRYKPVLVRHFQGRHFDCATSDDLVQETFFRAYRKLRVFRHKSNFRDWLLVISRIVYRDQLRSSLSQSVVTGRESAGMAERESVGKRTDEGQIDQKSPRISAPPGYKLTQLAEFFFSRKAFQTIIAPTIRDLQDEHLIALDEGRIWKTRWILMRGYWSFWATVFAQTPISWIKWLNKLWKAV